MKKSCDKTFTLTTSLVVTEFTPNSCNPQSALTPVRSVECGLFA